MLYDYIFWVIYNSNLKKDKSQWLSRNNASGVVFFSALVHFLLLLMLLKKFFPNLSLSIQKFDVKEYRGVSIIISLLCIYLTYLYYSKRRIEIIMTKFSAEKMYYFNTPLVALIIFVPLIVILIIGWMG
jgi:hypothetical protein